MSHATSSCGHSFCFILLPFSLCVSVTSGAFVRFALCFSPAPLRAETQRKRERERGWEHKVVGRGSGKELASLEGFAPFYECCKNGTRNPSLTKWCAPVKRHRRFLSPRFSSPSQNPSPTAALVVSCAEVPSFSDFFSEWVFLLCRLGSLFVLLLLLLSV